MNGPSFKKPSFKELNFTRKPINISQKKLFNFAFLNSESTLPMVIYPTVAEVDLVAWAQSHRSFLERNLLKYGALLLRGFASKSIDQFQLFLKTVSGGLLEYQERSSPRSEIKDHIYTSTDYPQDQEIFLHNENSYQRTYPMKIFFFCDTPAQQGGETPIADCRKIWHRIDSKIKEKFIQKKVMYVRNFGAEFGLPWQTVFQTTNKVAVEAYCRKSGIKFEWKKNNLLRTKQIGPVVAIHPKTGEATWFNHATFFHISTLDATLRNVLMANLKEDEFPNNTYYGDGTPIEPFVLDELREAYANETVIFHWQKGDILVLDNMLTAHGRKPFTGPRRVVVGMSEPLTHSSSKR